jgi:hypothetical protein
MAEILNSKLPRHIARIALIITQSRYRSLSDDPNVYFYPSLLIRRIAKTLLLLAITLLLLLPVVVCNIVNSTSIRIAIVMISTVSYLFILSVLTKSRTMELVLAGAT